MREVNSLSNVALFNKTFGHPVEPSPIIPSKDRVNLRISLIEEELEELKKAIEKNDIVEVADAFCDLQYVLSGAILEFGLGDKFFELFEEVQRSNLSKACRSKTEAEETEGFYKNVKREDCYISQKNNQYLIYRKSDNKLLKSIDYSPANLRDIIFK